MFNAKNIKTIFWGTPEFAVPCFYELLQKNYNIIAVVTQPDKPVGRNKKITAPPVKNQAVKYNIKTLQPEIIDENFIEKIDSLKPDLCIVVAYGKILSKKLLKIPKYGFINVHASLLPKLRGASPIQTAILGDHNKTGVTIMKMDEKMDHGPILKTKGVIIDAEDNFLSLHDKLKQVGADLLIDTIPVYILQNLKPKEQDNSQATYTKLITKESGRVDIVNDIPERIIQKIKAFSPWPGVWTIYNKKRLKILSASISKNQLIIEKVQPEGKKPMNWKEYINGN